MSAIETPDSLLDLYFGVLQGAPGEARDWAGFQRLFLGAAHIRTVVESGDGENLGDWTVDQFIEHARDLYESNGISQVETGRRTEWFGNTAHAWCRFESRLGIDGASPVSRGAQSIHMLRVGGSWWIVGINVQLEG